MAMLISYEWKWDNFGGEPRFTSPFRRACLELRAGIVEAAFDVAEGDFLSNPLAARRAGDPADFFAAGGSQFHPRSERNLAQRNQAA